MSFSNAHITPDQESNTVEIMLGFRGFQGIFANKNDANTAQAGKVQNDRTAFTDTVHFATHDRKIALHAAG
jgi:hypothetical protein